MASQSTSSHLRPEPFVPPHVWRHLISGTIVFLAGVCADVAVVKYLDQNKSAHFVVWQNSPVIVPVGPLPVLHDTNFVIFGLRDDGSMIWKPLK